MSRVWKFIHLPCLIFYTNMYSKNIHTDKYVNNDLFTLLT
nr:MAG TPA: hypothetical protein [Caudoviricetes sp.]